MEFYEKVIEEVQKITIYHWIRIGLCGLFTYSIIQVILPKIIAMYFIRRTLDIYNIATIFNETGRSQETINMTLDTLGSTIEFELAWYFILSSIICIAIWKWLGLPKKIINK